MGKIGSFRGLMASLIAAALLLGAFGAEASTQTRVLRGFLKNVDANGEGIILQVNSSSGGENLYFTLRKGARITYMGVSVDLRDFKSGSQVMVTYVPEDGKLVATDLRKIW